MLIDLCTILCRKKTRCQNVPAILNCLITIASLKKKYYIFKSLFLGMLLGSLHRGAMLDMEKVLGSVPGIFHLKEIKQ